MLDVAGIQFLSTNLGNLQCFANPQKPRPTDMNLHTPGSVLKTTCFCSTPKEDNFIKGSSRVA